MTRTWLLALVTACWTGPVPETTPPDQPVPKVREAHDLDLEISLQRTACFGMCPVFDVTIARDGTLHYVGRRNVAELGERTRRLSRTQMLALARSVDHVHFFELDRQGHEPANQACRTITNGAGSTTTTCSFSSFTVCTDTSHTIVTVQRPRQGKSHTIDDAHCSDDGAAESFEQRVEELVAPWVGR